MGNVVILGATSAIAQATARLLCRDGSSYFLAGRHHGTGVKAIDIKPGFVDTPMTAFFDKGGPLWSTPERVAKYIARALNGCNSVVYTPWFWRYIIGVIRCVTRSVAPAL